ncbi:MAG: selenocysteine-specific translation elongation factor [Candidatus Binatia bacterium]
MHFILGTAGHIDHGKTALIRALTGFDTDRLKEEKERGISIDIGFAYLDLPDGARAGIVDVPGHERFIKNMLAGAHGIDLVLFVVAADDGVMPQTEEHLDILHLLGVAAGIVVISKADLVDEARLRQVREDVEILTLDTVLEGAPALAVSSVTTAGIEELRAEIARRLSAVRPRARGGKFRLPVDRAFLMKGHGVVVTGTAVAGQVSPGETVRILPGGEEARVRSVQVHGLETARAERGQRVALNLVGVERTEVTRGHVIVHPSIDVTTDRIDARIEIRPLAKKPVPSRRRVRLHVGTAEVLARLVLLGGRGELAPREWGFAQIVCEEPIVAFHGDRFILRSESADRTIGGGEVVHPFAPRHRPGDRALSGLLERIDSAEPGRAILALLDMDREFARPPAWVAQALDLDVAVVTEAASTDEIEALPGTGTVVEALTTRAKWSRWLGALLSGLERFHGANPLLPGIEMELLRGQLPWEVPPKLFREIIDRLGREKRLVREESLVRMPAHAVALNREEQDFTRRLEALLEEGSYTPPDAKEMAERLKLGPKRVQELLQTLERRGRAAKVAGDLWYHAGVLERLRELVAARIRASGPIGASDFRDMIGATRKFAIPLLEFFDRTGFTIRVGDQRKLRRG